jgi:two-component system sensor histidine kinase VanS
VLDNAMKYAKEQGTVVVKAIEENNQWVLKVLNCGGKIEDENVAKLFEPFYRVEKSRNRNTGGSGLGLYIVKQVLDLHEVQYELKNTSEGVLFTMLFPKV